MAGLMDFLNGGMFGGTGAYDSLLTDDMKKKMQQQSMMAMAAQLLQAGGPSTTRTNLGQAIGGAWQAGQQAYNQAGQNALTQMLTKQKIEEYQRDKATKEKIQQYLMGVQAPAATPQDAGGLQGVIGQATPQGAMMRPGAVPAMPAAGGAAGGNKNAAIADRYRQLAMIIGPLDETKANAYLTMADKLSPQVKPVGQPFEVRNPQDPNSNILVQNYSDGTMKPVQGYSPAGMTDYQRQQLAISAANLGISREQLRRGEYTLQQTSEGFAYVPKVPGLPVIPVTAGGSQPSAGAGNGVQTYPVAPGAAVTPTQLKPAGAKPTADQSNAVGFSQRMERADAIMGSLQGKQPGTGSMLAGAVPFIGGWTQRQVMSQEQQQFKQAAEDWIRAKLRKESGAAIGEREMEQEYQTYFPMPGDAANVITQKAEARRVATQAMQQSAGEFYKPWTPSTTDARMIQQQTSPGTASGKLKWDPQRGWVME